MEASDYADSLKISRSTSLCAANELPSAAQAQDEGLLTARGAAIGADHGRFPPVLVLSHPSTRKMAVRLVQATTARLLKLRLESAVTIK